MNPVGVSGSEEIKPMVVVCNNTETETLGRCRHVRKDWNMKTRCSLTGTCYWARVGSWRM